MTRLVPSLAFVTLLAVGMAFMGCADTQSRQEPLSTIVPISEIKNVAGKWSGIAKRTPPAGRDDWLEVTIKEDGAYEYSSFRTIGAAMGSGRLTLKDGTLMSESDKASATYTLYDRGGKRVLVLEVTMKDGVHYSADLKPAK